MISKNSVPKPVTVPHILARKGERRLTMLTAYDYPAARLMDQVEALDMILVGDSVGNVELGYETTLPVTMDDMLHHVKAVRRGARRPLIVADMPFLSYQVNDDEALRNAGRLLQEGGANAVKLEGGTSVKTTIRRIVEAGIPVMAHIGLRPQSVNLTGFKVQGRTEEAARQVEEDALAVQEAGAFAVVLELLPIFLAEKITQTLTIPTIGIGSGPHCDGQVMVSADILDLGADGHALKHVKHYAHVGAAMREAFAEYCREVESGAFPGERESFR